MALVFYERDTGLMRRVVMDETHTDAELERRHPRAPDEAILRLDIIFRGVDHFDGTAIQRRIYEMTGLPP